GVEVPGGCELGHAVEDAGRRGVESWQPAVAERDVQVAPGRVLEDGADLGAEGGARGVARVDVSEDGPRAVDVVGDGRLRRVREVAGGPGGDQVAPSVATEECRSLTYPRWARVPEVARPAAGHIGEVVGEVGDDQ